MHLLLSTTITPSPETATMLMVSVSHMELQDPGTTCGPLLVVFNQVTVHVHILRVSHHMLDRTTSVKLPMMTVNFQTDGFLMTHSGMVETVGDPVTADPVPVSVPSTVLPGSASSCPRLQLTILKLVFAQNKRPTMRTLQWKSLNSIFTSDLHIVTIKDMTLSLL